MKQNTPKAQKNLQVAAALLLLLISVILTIALTPYFLRLRDPAIQKQFSGWIHSMGISGWFILLGVQMLQVIIAVIPGEPVELLAGVLYGTWPGMLTCLLGSVLASAVVFYLVRKLGPPFIMRFFKKDKLREFDFFQNARKVELTTFILFLIPGTPKDMLTYVAGISPIKPLRFLVISTLARIPSVITSTMLGDSVRSGNWKLTIATFILTAGIGILGILYKDRFIESLHRINQRRKKYSSRL